MTPTPEGQDAEVRRLRELLCFAVDVVAKADLLIRAIIDSDSSAIDLDEYDDLYAAVARYRSSVPHSAATPPPALRASGAPEGFDSLMEEAAAAVDELRRIKRQTTTRAGVNEWKTLAARLREAARAIPPPTPEGFDAGYAEGWNDANIVAGRKHPPSPEGIDSLAKIIAGSRFPSFTWGSLLTGHQEQCLADARAIVEAGWSCSRPSPEGNNS